MTTFDDFPSHENWIIGEWSAPIKKTDPRKLTRMRYIWVRGVEGIAASEVRVDFERTHDYVAFSRLSMAYLEHLKDLVEHPLTEDEKLSQKASGSRRAVLVRQERSEEAERRQALYESAIRV